MTFWSRGLARSLGKLKPLYLYYQSTYGHQTWQDGNLPSWASGYKMILKSRGLVRSRDNSKKLYFHFYNANIHQTWQAGDLPWGDSTHNVTPLRGPVKFMWQTKTIMPPTTISMAAKLGTMLTYLDWFLPISQRAT